MLDVLFLSHHLGFIGLISIKTFILGIFHFVAGFMGVVQRFDIEF
jgi:hypothetical protein